MPADLPARSRAATPAAVRTHPSAAARALTPAAALARLARLRDTFDPAAAAAKGALLRRLAHARLGSAAAVLRLHEILCFLRAYPDDAGLLAQVESMLARFEHRADLRAHRAALADSGIAGTAIRDRFFYPQALWLARRWPEALSLDREDTAADALIARALPQLVTPHEAIALRERELAGYDGLDWLLARGRPSATGAAAAAVADPAADPAVDPAARPPTDATFLMRRIAELPGDSRTREAFGDAIDASFVLRPAPGSPSRTHAGFAPAPRGFQRASLQRPRPDLAAELRRAPRRIRRLSAADGDALVDLARAAMATRTRALEAFSHGDGRDAWLVEDGEADGARGSLAFAFAGMLPERRHPVAAIYGGLMLRNGVPIGYLQGDVFGRSVAVSFNTFETFRGGEAAHVFARMLAAFHALFGSTAFTIEPYQLGHGNHEGLASGAWWFYRKLGFVPRDPATLRVLRAETARLARDPRHRSHPDVLQRLARHHLFFDLDPARPHPLPPLVAIGRQVADALNGTPDGRAAREDAVRAAMRACGLATLAGLRADERRAWAWWSPMVPALGVERWSPAERAALVSVIRAKGGRSERDYVARWLGHPRLEAALRSFGRA